MSVPASNAQLTAPHAGLDRKRLFTAFTLTPLLSGFYPAIFLAEPSVMPIGLLLAYASAALFGVPLVVWFSRRVVREWWLYAIGGAACSVPTVLLYAFAPTPEHMLPFGIVPVLSVLIWGASSGVVFWMLGVAGDSPVSLRSLFDPLPPKR
jgi:Na+/melibiose symporter-like transporter